MTISDIMVEIILPIIGAVVFLTIVACIVNEYYIHRRKTTTQKSTDADKRKTLFELTWSTDSTDLGRLTHPLKYCFSIIY